MYRWSGSAWVSVQDGTIATAQTTADTGVTDAATAQSEADRKVVTFIQISAPIAEQTGDIWFDSDDSNKVYRWSGSAWVDAQDLAANWSAIIDDDGNQPESNATVGATAGTDLTDSADVVLGDADVINVPLFFQAQSPVNGMFYDEDSDTLQVSSEYQNNPDNMYMLHQESAGSNALKLYRLIKNAFGTYIYAGTSIVVTGTSGAHHGGVAVIGDYVYVIYKDGNFIRIKRYDKDLTNATAMTLDWGGEIEGTGPACVKGTDFYFIQKMDIAATPDYLLNKFTISGTTMTWQSESAAAFENQGFGLYSDGTDFFTIDKTGTITRENSAGTTQGTLAQAICAGITDGGNKYEIEYPMGIVRAGYVNAVVYFINYSQKGTSNNQSTKLNFLVSEIQ